MSDEGWGFGVLGRNLRGGRWAWGIVLIRAYTPLLGWAMGLLPSGVSLNPSPPRTLHPAVLPARPHPHPTPTSPTLQALLTSPDFNKGNLESITSRISEI